MQIPVIPATPPLDGATIHLWRLPYRRQDGRAPLRALLGVYLGRAADSVQLHDDRHGRPALAEPDAWLHFNWSHSGSVAVVALARDLPTLGVDVEVLRERARAGDLARRYFAADEATQLAALDAGERARGFLRLWTAKEAVLKGLGRGLAYGLDRIVFDIGGDEPVPRRFEGEVGAASTWQVRECPCGEDVVVSLAWRGPPRQVLLRSTANPVPTGTSSTKAGP